MKIVLFISLFLLSIVSGALIEKDDHMSNMRMMHADNTTTDFLVPSFMKTGPKEEWPGQFGVFKDRTP